MKTLFKKIISILAILVLNSQFLVFNFSQVEAKDEAYTKYRTIDK
jgi:hypothetical protein